MAGASLLLEIYVQSTYVRPPPPKGKQRGLAEGGGPPPFGKKRKNKVGQLPFKNFRTHETREIPVVRLRVEKKKYSQS